MSLLSVQGVSKSYTFQKHRVHAVRNVSFSIQPGQCLGLVGASGSGKSTIARLLLMLDQPDQGEIWINGIPVTGLNDRRRREVRKSIQAVFQDPASALNPRLPVWRSVIEPLDNFKDVTPSFLSDVRNCRRKTAAKLLDMVGMHDDFMDLYPHELSGGQRQRVAIARGIAIGPQLLVCDEPTSSLDVSVQAQIISLLKQLKQELSMSYLFISHELATLASISDVILTMCHGEVVDYFHIDQLLERERHLYTRLLVSKA